MSNPTYEGGEGRFIKLVPGWVVNRPGYFLARRFNSALQAEKQKRRELEARVKDLERRLRDPGAL